jgi:hypothetical protein
MSNIDQIADVIELQVWANARPETQGSLKALLQAAQDDVSEQDAESLAQNVMDEFSSRQQLLGDAYPFDCDGYRLEIRNAEPHNTTYLFCLGLSLLPSAEIKNEQRDRQFETIVMNAAKRFFGADGIRIGAPWYTEEFPTYGALLDKVIDLIPDLGEKLREVAPGGGDGGWDVLIVKGFKDNKFPRLIALGNCATGRSDWTKKGFETSPSWFWDFFSHKPHNVYLTFFAVPFVMDEDIRVKKHAPTNLTFDRFRICEFAPLSIDGAAQWLSGQREHALAIPVI